MQDDQPSGTRNEFNLSFKQLKWEYNYLARNRVQNFIVDCITFENILDTAVIIPYFSFENRRNKSIHQMPIMGKPDINDRFHYIEKNYFDRTGWDELSIISIHQNIDKYITDNFIGSIPNDIEEDKEDEEEDEENVDEYYKYHSLDLRTYLDLLGKTHLFLTVLPSLSPTKKNTFFSK